MGRASARGEGPRPVCTPVWAIYPASAGSFQLLWTTCISLSPATTWRLHKLVDLEVGVCAWAVGKNIFGAVALIQQQPVSRLLDGIGLASKGLADPEEICPSLLLYLVIQTSSSR